MNLIPRPRFTKRYKKMGSGLREKFWERIDLLISDPFNPLLHNHGLKGEFEGSRSINITGDIRLIYNQPDRETILFIIIGTHSELYGK